MATASAVTAMLNVGIPVSDPDRALAFYRDALGMEVRRDLQFGAGQRWVEVAPPGSAATVALTPPGPAGGPGRDTGVRLAVTDAAAAHAALRDRGADVDAEVMRLGGPVPPMFALRDPDGNQLYIVESR
ncbi:MAG TPA: VOC family protein [Dehalococcoidia bacterium]|nr:VOC family protein [Dehalococcoidia bacterium]